MRLHTCGVSLHNYKVWWVLLYGMCTPYGTGTLVCVQHEYVLACKSAPFAHTCVILLCHTVVSFM